MNFADGSNRKHRRNSVWDSFIKSKDKQSAKCRLCGQKMKLNSTSNLWRHLEVKHGNQESTKIMYYVAVDKEDEANEQSSDDESIADKVKEIYEIDETKFEAVRRHGMDAYSYDLKFSKPKGNSPAWKYFLRSDDAFRAYAKCIVCQKIMKCEGGSTSALNKHLSAIHSINYEKKPDKCESDTPIEVSVQNEEEFTDAKPNHPNTAPSPVWKHFLRSKDGLSAKCKICHKVIKCGDFSTSGLLSHLQTRHKNQESTSDYSDELVEKNMVESEDEEEFTDAKPNRPNTAPSPVWKHFLRSKDGLAAKCKICHKVIKCGDFSTSSLLSHLRTRHKNQESTSDSSDELVRKKMVESEDDEVFSDADVSDSPPWKHFLVNNDKCRAKCKICHTVIKCDDGSTSGLRRHLASKHCLYY